MSISSPSNQQNPIIAFQFCDVLALHGDEDARQLLWPRRATASASGFDLVAANLETIEIPTGKRALIPTGIACAIPIGYEGQVRPRSGLAMRFGVTCLNSPGTIDADYRGEIKVILINHGDATFVVERGMRIAQLVISPVLLGDVICVAQLDNTERGAGGFGSTGLHNTPQEQAKIPTKSPTELLVKAFVDLPKS